MRKDRKGHWLWRQVIVIGSLFALLVVGAIAMVALIDNDNNGNRGGNDAAGFICLGAVGGLLLWLVGAAVAQATAIRATDMTDKLGPPEGGVAGVRGEPWPKDREQYEEEREASAAKRRRERRRPPAAALGRG